MSLIHHSDQVGPAVVALTCHECKIRWPLDEIDLDGELRCPDCGAGGLIAHTASRMSERFPDEIAGSFVPVPVALLHHRAALGIGPHEMLVIIALEQHRRLLGDEVYSFRNALADLTGLSVDQVKRATGRLCAAGLLTQRQSGSLKGERGRGPNYYDLTPLWTRLALQCGGAPQTPDIAGAHAPQTDTEDASEHLRALDNPFAGAEDPICGAPVHHEVEVRSRSLEVEPYGTRPASPDRAATAPDSDDDVDPVEAAKAKSFQAYCDEHPRMNRLSAYEAWLPMWEADNVNGGREEAA